jgi:NAD(P)-dependent dehydrogenase (short-subunit alcohol dehydrogenase family)
MTDNTSTALITGGTSGIGLATAKKLAQLGIHVLVVGRNAERGNKAVEEIRTAGGKADFISSELLGADSAREVARKAIELGSGHVDILINNAGIYPFGPTHEMTEEQFDRVFSTNVKAPYFLLAVLAPLMAERGKGAIVNLSTMVADYGAPGMSLYGSSKAAINLLTKTWAAEYGPKGVRVNAVSPELRAQRVRRRWARVSNSYSRDRYHLVSNLSEAVEHDLQQLQIDAREQLASKIWLHFQIPSHQASPSRIRRLPTPRIV